MCEKCAHQEAETGNCTNKKSEKYGEVCPGIDMKADVRECPFSAVIPCGNNRCQKCER